MKKQKNESIFLDSDRLTRYSALWRKGVKMHSFLKVLFLSTTLALTACTDNSQVFSSAVTGAPKPTSTAATGSAGSAGYYKIGNPYQVDGLWYYPKEDYTYKEIGISSWYGPDFHNGITANGELYDMHGLTAAHRTLPLPSVVRVTNLQNGRSLVLRVNDRGPFVNNRVIDVSMRAAQLLGFKDQGTTQVQVEIMPEESKKLKEELLAAAGGTSSSAANSASAASLGATEYAVQEQPIAKPQNLGYSPNYPRLANQPPAAVGAGMPLIAASAEKTGPKYNDWDEDLPQAQAKKTVNASAQTAVQPSKTAPAVKSAPKKDSVPAKMSAVVAPGYYVQVGAFGSLENAQRMRDRVSSYGPALILPVTVNAKTLYRVRLGPESAKKALEMMDKVTAGGLSDARLVEEKGTVSAGKRLDSAF